jgi:signal transduction histidine kinase
LSKFNREKKSRNQVISNSIKFTNENGKIEIDAEERAANEIVIRIRDNGIGMGENTINKLFKLQEKITTLGTNHEKGAGLGLILIKEFVEKNNGEIFVESKEGEGTQFTLLFKNKIDKSDLSFFSKP